jgi:hypothetical protein
VCGGGGDQGVRAGLRMYCTREGWWRGHGERERSMCRAKGGGNEGRKGGEGLPLRGAYATREGVVPTCSALVNSGRANCSVE